MSMPSTTAPANSRAIDKNILGDSIFERVLSDIISMRYQPGERLNVDSIAQEFEVSRTPVREALIRLAATRFVEVVRNSRTQVAEWDAGDIRDRLEVAGRLVRLVMLDPRLDVVDVAARLEPVPSTGCCGDVQVFLDLGSSIVTSRVNRVAGYVLRELITPVRIFFRPEVLATHGLDLSSTDDERRLLINAALESARSGDAACAEQILARYTTRLAGVTSPRNGDPAPPTSTAAALEAAFRPLQPLQ